MAELREFQTEHKQAILKLTFYNTDNFLCFLFWVFFFAVIPYIIRLTSCDSGGSTEQKNNRLSKHTNILCYIQFYNTSIISLEAQVKAIALFCFMRETIEFD